MPDSYPTTSFKLMTLRQPGILGPVYDLDLGEDGGPQLVEGSKELAQSIALRLRMVRGEAWEEPDCGLPWFDFLGAKPGNRNLLRHEILLELRKDERITQVDSLTISEDAQRRGVDVKALVRGVDGSTVRVEV